MARRNFFQKLIQVGPAPWILLVGALLPLPDANGRLANLPTICPFHALTGAPCPGCGLTRAVVCLCHGRFSESLAYHPLALAVLLAAASYPFLKRRPERLTVILWVVIGLLLGLWPLRLLGWIAPMPRL